MFKELFTEAKITKKDLQGFINKTILIDGELGQEEYYCTDAYSNKLKCVGKHGSKGGCFNKVFYLKDLNKLTFEIKDYKPDWVC